jgi:O-antigen/teichoic acid export membrane protein
LINTCFTISSLVSVILAVIFILGLPFWSPAFIPEFDNFIFSGLFICFSVVFTLLPLLMNIFLGKRVTKYIVYVYSVSGISKIGLLLIIIFVSNDVFGLFFISGIATIVGFAIGIYYYLPKLAPSFHLTPTIHVELLQNIRNYSAVNYISRILLQVTPLVLPLMIVNILGSRMNAYFAVSWTFISIIQIIPTSIFNSLLAECTFEEKLNTANIRKSLILMFALLIPCIVFFIVFPNLILSVFGSTYSDNGFSLIQILVLSIIPWSMIYLFVTIERFKKSSTSIIFITLGSAVLSIGFSYLFMLEWGLTGAGLGYLAGQTLVALIAVVLLLSLMKETDSENVTR